MKTRLKKYIPSSRSMKNSRQLKGLRPFFKNPCYRSYSLQSVARGVAAGLAGSVIPGFQLFYAAVLVILLQGNLLVALVATFITNPFTAVPMTYLIYTVGKSIVGNGHGCKRICGGR